MALQILNAGPAPEKICAEIRGAIKQVLSDAEVEVVAASPGHFEIQVRSASFADRSRVQQQQSVYAAIAHLMKGDSPPVHAVDRMECLLP
ncbi:MAG: BolA/IbaG family iron-sulfur metabolism protein [Myxococcota bacterium]